MTLIFKIFLFLITGLSFMGAIVETKPDTRIMFAGITLAGIAALVVSFIFL